MTSRRYALAALMLASLAMPLRAIGQQPGRLYRIGFMYTRLRPTSANPDIYLETFVRRLGELGYVEGRNLTIEWRFANNDYGRFPGHATELAGMGLDAIVTTNLLSTQAAQRATTTTPIVFAVMQDPVGSGIVTSLARPDGNVTGLSLMAVEVVPKQVELLHAIIPKLTRLSVLINPLVPIHKTFLEGVQAAAQKIGASVQSIEARNPEEVEQGFEMMSKWSTQAAIVPPDSFFIGQRARIVQFALKKRIPIMSSYGADAEAGALLSYGQDLVAYYRRAAELTDKLLKGTKVGDIPIEQPMVFQFMVNLRTAKTLGVKIPSEAFLRADRIIE